MDYRPEGKLSIRGIKEAAIAKLQMSETYALDFARFLIEKSTTIQVDKEAEVDESVTAMAMKVMLTIFNHTQRSDTAYFTAQSESKMKLIIGEKLQEKSAKNRLLTVLN